MNEEYNKENEEATGNISDKENEDSSPEINNIEKERNNKPTVRTYRDFAVKALRGKTTSLAKMIIKEKKKRENDYQYSPKNKKNVLMIIVSSVLILLGVLAVGSILVFTIHKGNNIGKDDKPIAPKSIIYFDYKEEHNLDNMERIDIIKLVDDMVENTAIPIGSNKIFYFIKKNETGKKRLATAEEFFEVLDTRASAGFIKNLNKEFTTGVVSTIENVSPFMILRISNFDTVYSAILAWENTMLIDIGNIFNVNKKYFSQKFSDVSLYNKDTRVILDERGKIVFGYSFLDLKTLVFFTDNISFRKIIAILETQKEKF